jgi:hypothetical protein
MSIKETYTLVTDSIPDYNEAYLNVFEQYQKIPGLERDFVHASVTLGVVNWDKPALNSLSDIALVYLKELEKVNTSLLALRYCKNVNKGHEGTQASFSSMKTVLRGVIKLNATNRIFYSWISKNSPSAFITRSMAKITRDNARKTPIHINRKYYMELLKKMFKEDVKPETTSLLRMEMITGRRVSECHLENFKRLDTTKPSDRSAIIDYYRIIDPSIIDTLVWYSFSTQLKVYKDDIAAIKTYPIPLLYDVSEDVFNALGNNIIEVVTKYNISKSLEVGLWTSRMGGVRYYRSKTVKLQRALLPNLDKTHNIRAIYGSLMSKYLLPFCNMSDTVAVMGRLMGHTDTATTDHYRVIKIDNTSISNEEISKLFSYTHIVSEVSSQVKDIETRGRKQLLRFIGWTDYDKRSYKAQYENEDSYNDLEVIAKGVIDLKDFSDGPVGEYKEVYKQLLLMCELDTGLSYKRFKYRYSEADFKTIYNIAKEVKRNDPVISTHLMCKEMDIIYSQLFTDKIKN